MSKVFISLFHLFLLCHSILAQRSQCDLTTYNDFIAKGKSLVQSGDYIQAFEYYNSAKDYCPEKGKVVDSLVQGIILQIDKDKRRTYANDLTYKSQIALRDGDRTTAFRLAEFAYRYVDNDNPLVARALFEALYCNDNPERLLPLHWKSNLGDPSSKGSGVITSRDGKRLASGTWDSPGIALDIWKTGKEAISLEAHSDYINSIAFAPNGKWLVTGSEDSTAKIWDLTSSKTTLTLQGHANRVLSVAFSMDGSRIATASGDKSAKVWDINTGKNILSLEGHSSDVSSVVFSPDGNFLATGSYDKTAKIWDINTGKEILTLWGHESPIYSLAFSPRGDYLATGSGDESGNNSTAKIWSITTGEEILSIKGINDIVRSVAFSPEGNWLAITSGSVAKIWDINTANEMLSLEGHRYSIYSISFAPDGKRLATGAFDQMAKIWDLNTGKEILSIQGHRNGISSVVFSPDGRHIATGSFDKIAKIWELPPEACISRAHQNLSLATLTFDQLKAYNLDDLLDQHPDNEQKLITTGETWQIAAFADLYAEKFSKGIPKKIAYYARAKRLYKACLTSGLNDKYFEERLAELNRHEKTE